jgi:Methyltransferase FkbM domain
MFNSKSQAQQDLFVWILSKGKKNGSFIEIGSHHPININNTYELEQNGWRGYLFDNDPKWTSLTTQLRKSIFILADVTTYDWDTFIIKYNLNNSRLDYLSFDVDEASIVTLRRFPFNKLSFNICTVEHDSYRFGNDRANEMRNIMQNNGYVILFKDISNDNLSYEDWYVHSTFLSTEEIQRYYAENLDWKEAIKRIQIN